MKRYQLLFVLAVAACGHKSPDQTATPTPEPVDRGSASATSDTGSASVAAGSAASTPETPPTPPTPEPPPAPPPKPAEDTFIKLTKDEKTKIMKTKLAPAMAKAFKQHDAKKFAKFDCKTCHGKGAKSGFKMPNPDLPKLDFAALQAGTLDPKVMEMAKFMGETVTPETAKILGLTEFDPKHPELGGFGCLGCHEIKK